MGAIYIEWDGVCLYSLLIIFKWLLRLRPFRTMFCTYDTVNVIAFVDEIDDEIDIQTHIPFTALYTWC